MAVYVSNRYAMSLSLETVCALARMVVLDGFLRVDIQALGDALAGLFDYRSEALRLPWLYALDAGVEGVGAVVDHAEAPFGENE